MPGITREEVVHFARLSHLDLTSDELDHLTPQLDGIVRAVARVGEARADGPSQDRRAARSAGEE